MPDIYTRVTVAPSPILEGLMAALELRAADPQLRAMLTTYLTDAALPQGSRVLEVGCGTGAVTRSVAKWPGASAAVGVDVACGEYFGHIAYLSLIARRSA